MTPSELTAWLTAFGLAVTAAAAWGVKAWSWYWSTREKVRKAKRAEHAEEEEEYGVPHRKVSEGLKRDLAKTLEGMAKLTGECTGLRVRVAKLESDNEHCQKDNVRLDRELVESREEQRKLWEEIRLLKNNPESRRRGPESEEGAGGRPQ